MYIIVCETYFPTDVRVTLDGVYLYFYTSFGPTRCLTKKTSRLNSLKGKFCNSDKLRRENNFDRGQKSFIEQWLLQSETYES